MCCIIFIPSGVQTPPYEVIRNVYRCNPHGMGLCTPADHYRGMSLNALLRHLKKRDISHPCLMHFRLATHGSIKKANCHPFYDGESETWFMHNGVLDITPKGDTTDSETAFREILAPTIAMFGLSSEELRCNVRNIIGGSRFAFMQGDRVKLFGQYEQWLGCWFSNLRFRYWYYN